jgi:TAG lipase/steryl ester hydrolase/phospholipase A2/LPA acyltransferase
LIDRYITTALETIATLVDLSVHEALRTPIWVIPKVAPPEKRSALRPNACRAASSWSRIAGSIVCAVFCTRTDDELPALLDTYVHGDFDVFNEK